MIWQWCLSGCRVSVDEFASALSVVLSCLCPLRIHFYFQIDLYPYSSTLLGYRLDHVLFHDSRDFQDQSQTKNLSSPQPISPTRLLQPNKVTNPFIKTIGRSDKTFGLMAHCKCRLSEASRAVCEVSPFLVWGSFGFDHPSSTSPNQVYIPATSDATTAAGLPTPN